MDIKEVLLSIGNSLTNFFTGIGDFFASIYDLLISVSSFILNIFGFIFYAGKTLITGVGKLFGYITGVAEWSEVSYTLGSLSTYIGPWGVLFISAMLLLIITRILISFVFRLLKGRDSYEVRKTNWKKGREQTWEKHISDSLDEFEGERRIFR